MRVVVWDWPLRIFHGLFALSVIGAFVTVKLGGEWMQWHERFGIAVIGLVSFRLVWGFVGPHHARFGNFFPTPSSLLQYLKGEWQGLGHNPLGALSVFALLLVFLGQAIGGLFANDDIVFRGPLSRLLSSEQVAWVTSWHRAVEPVLLGLVALHVLAILIYRLRGQKLVSAMLCGGKDVAENTVAPPVTVKAWALALSILIALVALYVASGNWIEVPPPLPADVPAW